MMAGFMDCSFSHANPCVRLTVFYSNTLLFSFILFVLEWIVLSIMSKIDIRANYFLCETIPKYCLIYRYRFLFHIK